MDGVPPEGAKITWVGLQKKVNREATEGKRIKFEECYRKLKLCFRLIYLRLFKKIFIFREVITMTTCDNFTYNEDVIHPTDLSLKGIFGAKSSENLGASPVGSTSSYFPLKQRRLSYNGEANQYWRSRITTEQRPMSSPISTAMEERFACELPTVEDHASARLYALDAFLSHHRDVSPPVFDSFYFRKSPHMEVDSDDDDPTSPVSQSLLAVTKSKIFERFYKDKACYDLLLFSFKHASTLLLCFM